MRIFMPMTGGPLFAGLHIARQEFGLLVDLSTRPSKAVFGKESTRTSAFWPSLTRLFGFGNVDANEI